MFLPARSCGLPAELLDAADIVDCVWREDAGYDRVQGGCEEEKSERLRLLPKKNEELSEEQKDMAELDCLMNFMLDPLSEGGSMT